MIDPRLTDFVTHAHIYARARVRTDALVCRAASRDRKGPAGQIERLASYIYIAIAM